MKTANRLISYSISALLACAGLYALTFAPLSPLADFSLSPAEAIGLQAALAETPIAVKDPATLDGILRSIDIRTALEDTSRLRYELG